MTAIEIRAEWACPDCGARAATFSPPRGLPFTLSKAEPVAGTLTCANGHEHRLPEGACYRMTDEEWAAVEAARREAEEEAAREAAEFKARIEGRTITGYEMTDATATLALDDGSVLRIEAGGDGEAWLSATLEGR